MCRFARKAEAMTASQEGMRRGTLTNIQTETEAETKTKRQRQRRGRESESE